MLSFWKRFVSYFCKKRLILASLRLLILLSTFLVLFSSCLKHELAEFQSHSIQTTDEITSVYFRDGMDGIAAGGNTWIRAIACRTNDGGKSWNTDSLYDKEIFCSSHDEAGLFIAMGIELNLYELRPQETVIHKMNYQGGFRFIRGVSMYDSNNIIAVHGLGNGSIEKFSLYSDSTRTVLNINHELNAIQCIDSLHWIACGFGIVLRSKDAGIHWDTLEVFGDHFVDIAWLAPTTMYIVGAGGIVLRSDNTGIHFYEVKSGGVISNAPPFRCISFKNIQEGLIAGENGLVMLTRDGGSSWSIVDGLPDCDVKDIYFDGSQYWLCGSSGTIISFRI